MSDSRRRYDAVKEKLRQEQTELWLDYPEWMTNLSLMVSAIVSADDLSQSAIAAEMPLYAQQTSLNQRQRRWLMNERVPRRDCYGPLIQPFVRAASEGTLPLILDTTGAGRGCHLLVASIGYQRRALPVAWKAGAGERGHTDAQTQQALLRYVETLMPAEAEVVLLGDGEFSSVEALAGYQQRGWDFVTRVASDTYILHAGESMRIDQLQVQPGETLWLEAVQLTDAHAYGPLNLLVTWDEERDQLLPLVSSLSRPEEVRKWYAKRFWTEPLFGDLKGHGFDLQSSRLVHPERIAQLMLALALAYLWMVFLGAWVFASGYAKFVDRSDRRDRSLFTLGRRWLQRLLKLDHSLSVHFCPDPALAPIPDAGAG